MNLRFPATTRPASIPTRRILATIASAVLLSSPGALAGYHAAPAGAAVDGGADALFQSAGVSQVRYRQADLDGLKAGDTITGLGFRIDRIGAQFGGTVFQQFDIRLGTAAGSFGTNFAKNFASPPTLVRAGALSLAAADMPSGNETNPFGRVIEFTGAWTYPGGDIVVELRNSAPVGDVLRIDAFTSVNGKRVGPAAYATGSPAAKTAASTEPSYNWAVAFEVTPGGTRPVSIRPGRTGREKRHGIPLSIKTGLTGQNRYLPWQLGSLKPGDRIVGMAFRPFSMDSGIVSSTYPRFDVRIGRASEKFSTSAGISFASNFSGPPTLVRTGPATLYFPETPSGLRPFVEPALSFRKAHTYTGGPLLIETRTLPGSNEPMVEAMLDGAFGGSVYSVAGPDSKVSDESLSGIVWDLRLEVLRDVKAPRIRFAGKPKLVDGKAVVMGKVIEAGAAGTIKFRSNSKRPSERLKIRDIRSASQNFSLPITREAGRRVKTRITATDASGNRRQVTRIYKANKSGR